MKNYLNEMIDLKEQKDTIIVNAAKNMDPVSVMLGDFPAEIKNKINELDIQLCELRGKAPFKVYHYPNAVSEIVGFYDNQDDAIAACAGYEKCIVENVITGQDIKWMNWEEV